VKTQLHLPIQHDQSCCREMAVDNSTFQERQKERDQEKYGFLVGKGAKCHWDPVEKDAYWEKNGRVWKDVTGNERGRMQHVDL